MTQSRIFNLLFFGAILVSAMAGPAVAAPSFDCENVKGAAEKYICEDEMLNALDRRIAEVYERAKEISSPEDGELIQTQRQWIEDRNSCINSPQTHDCMKREYALRISYLEVKHGLLPVSSMSRYECEADETGKTYKFKAMTYNTIIPALVLWPEDKARQFITFLGRLEGQKLYTGSNAKLYRENGRSIIEIEEARYTCSAF